MALQGPLIPIVLIPRFTSYFNTAGSRDFPSVALDVSAYVGGDVVIWCGPLLGTSSPTITVTAQDSEDGQNWSNLATGGAGSTSAVMSLTLTRRWLRVLVTITGTNAAITCWCAGSLEQRVA